MLREDEDKILMKKLQNPPKPINSTEASPEMQDYINRMNKGDLQKEAAARKEAEAKKKEEENGKYELFCPTCRRPSLKRGSAPNTYVCNMCGLHTNAPLQMVK